MQMCLNRMLTMPLMASSRLSQLSTAQGVVASSTKETSVTSACSAAPEASTGAGSGFSVSV
eukprot:2296602-Pyramimonas_sp.AAC.1